MDSNFIASEIIKQLGGNKFIAMTGAKQLIALKKGGLIFKLPSNFASAGINLIKIELDLSDTYTMYFYKARGASLKEIKIMSMVYCDELQSVFTDVTGLNTYL